MAMTCPPLCVIQARYHSTRLPGKMLLEIGGQSLIEMAWETATWAFSQEDCVVAIPKGDESGPLGDELRRIGARIFAWEGPESDVLGRFYACAHHYRWHPDSVIVRYTADDWQKDEDALRLVAAGERLPVEQGGEAFTLAMLDAAHERERTPKYSCYFCGDGDLGEDRWVKNVPADGCGYLACGGCYSLSLAEALRMRTHIPPSRREHLTYALFPTLPPPPPAEGGPWSIDTQEDLDAARKIVEALR